MGFVGRIEGMGKALWHTGKKSAEFFIDIGQEAVGIDDEFEGDNLLDAIWGSWKDNVLGEQGVVNSLFGPDTHDKETGEYGGGFGGLFFGSIPEEVRSASNTIIIREVLDKHSLYLLPGLIGHKQMLKNVIQDHHGSTLRVVFLTV